MEHLPRRQNRLREAQFPTFTTELRQAEAAAQSRLPHRLLTYDDAAAYLGVSRRTIENWTAQKRLTKYVIGTRLCRVNIDELDQMATRVSVRKPSLGGPLG